MGLYKFKVPVMTKYGTLGGKIYDSADFEPGFFEQLELDGLVEQFIYDKDLIAKDKDLTGKVDALTSSLAQKANSSQLPQNQNYLQLTTVLDTPQTPLDVAHFARNQQKIAFVLHNYTDNRTAQFDNVGSATILQLTNASNPIRRDDKPADYVGTGNFLDLVEYINGGNSSVFQIRANAEFYWSGLKGTALFRNNKENSTAPAFEMKAVKPHEELLRIASGTQYVFSFRNDSPDVNGVNRRAVLESFFGQNEGLYITTRVGGIRLKSAGGVTTMEDNVVITGNLTLPTIAATAAQRKSIFVDSTTNVLSYKDHNGVVKAITLT
jgi:hypothetical protein